MNRLGVHTSIAGGIPLSLERAKELGCTTVQIFSHNPRTWLVQPINKESVLAFRSLKREYGIFPVFIHSSYLINLASANNEVREKSVQMLIEEMDLADSLDAEYVVLHTGSASNDPENVGRERARAALKAVSKKKWAARLLLENTAGERGDISSRMEHLAEIMDGLRSLIAGVCIDTCHSFQAGYDLSKKEGVARIAADIERFIGQDHVKLIHLNDSKKEFDSGVDRHEHIGIGRIGKEGLKRFINHPAFKDIPLILETPKKSEDDDPRNLKVVRGMMKK